MLSAASFAVQGKENLEAMERIGIIIQRDEPTAWTHSMLVTEKKDRSIRLWIDPGELDGAQESGEDVDRSILHRRATPISGTTVSLAQLLLSRCIRTDLPVMSLHNPASRVGFEAHQENLAAATQQ